MSEPTSPAKSTGKAIKVSEDEFSREVIAFFGAKLGASKWANVVTVGEKKQILKDLTVRLDESGHWKLLAGFQQQDVVFYAPAQVIPLTQFRSAAMRIERRDAATDADVIVPLIVCELKIGATMVTHSFITYGSISAQLKQVFPHRAYYFIVDSKQWRRFRPETLVRHTKDFDRVFLDWASEKESVWNVVAARLEYLGELGLFGKSHG